MEKNGNNEKGKKLGFPYIAENIFAPIYPVIASNIVKESGIHEGTCIDLGCGIASLGIALAEITDMHVMGVDLSKEMCKLSKNKAQRHGTSTKLTPIVADVHRLPFKDNYADLVISRGSVFFWNDLAVAFNEIGRVLAPGGQAWIGGGFGTKELKEQITEKMMAIDPQWQTSSKERLSPEMVQAIQTAAEQTGLDCRKVQDDSGFWIVISKGNRGG